jgi:hypothetical protein
MRVIDPRERLPVLAAQRSTTPTDLSQIISERPRYLHRSLICEGRRPGKA